MSSPISMKARSLPMETADADMDDVDDAEMDGEAASAQLSSEPAPLDITIQPAGLKALPAEGAPTLTLAGLGQLGVAVGPCINQMT